jgi:MFS family permease
LLCSVAAAAVGFVARPLGALLFGHFGDTRGRGITLLLSVLGMGVPTVLIGCLPTYKEIGIAAPALLVVLRAAQGIAMGKLQCNNTFRTGTSVLLYCMHAFSRL